MVRREISRSERSSEIVHRLLSTGRGSQGAWQKFERGQIYLFPFYEQFSRELSDVDNGNKWYIEYCERKNIGEHGTILSKRRWDFIRMAACPELPQKLVIDGREVRALQAFDG